MLAVPPQRIRDDVGETGEDEFLVGRAGHRQLVDFGDSSLLDCIDFDDLFADIEGDGDLLPGLEMVDHDVPAEFSATSGGEESEMNVSEVPDGAGNGGLGNDEDEDGDKSASGRDESGTVDPVASNPPDEGGRGGGRKKSSSVQSKSNPPQGKRKTKVDWTPDLHRRFVQAVEQLGLDKAVPSKILEIMGIECLTRHNIASHLQKYRSHRKHQLAREAENHQRRQMYSGGKTELSPWLISGPAMGFPPPVVQPTFRPLHVWGHPSADQSAWPQHAARPLPPAPPPRLPWSPVGLGPPYSLPPLLVPPLDPTSYWHPHQHQGLMSGPPVPGIPSSAMYKVDPCIGLPTDRSGPQPPPHSHPSKETIDAAIGDALTKPWQPLPLGLKPPSLDGVLTELHRQGIPRIPPS